MTTTQTVDWAGTFPERDVPQVGAEGRQRIKSWLRWTGCTGSFVDRLTMAELNAAWTDCTNETLTRYFELSRVASAARAGERTRPLTEDRVREIVRETLLMACTATAP